MNEEELNLIQGLITDIEYLLEYARRVAQGQVVDGDVKIIMGIRKDIKKAKEVFSCL